MITKDIAVQLRHGQILHHVSVFNSDGTQLRARVNGKVQTWKTRPDQFKIPVKYGLKTCFYIDNFNAEEWELPC